MLTTTQKLRRSLLVIAAVSTLAMAAPAAAAVKLRMVFIETANSKQIDVIHSMNLDIAHSRVLDNGNYKFDVVISESDEAALKKAGFSWREMDPRASEAPSSMRSFGTAPEETNYFDFDTGGTGLRDQMYQLASQYPHLVRIKTYGHSLQGRELLALNITRHDDDDDDDDDYDDDKPEVLYVHTMHAREWVSPYVGMRIVRHLLENYGKDRRITNMLNNISFWSIPVQNPDGYQYTHLNLNTRLWRKNLRDNDGDGVITNADGVDLNRNWAGHWGLDNEGSSPNGSSGTYRGTAPFSEPENAALRNFMAKHDFKFMISYHTYSNLILYPLGWQVTTPSLDDPVFVAQAGTDDNPAIFDRLMNAGYDPGVSADLYTTNGEFTDWAYEEFGLPSYTVELTAGEHPDGTRYTFKFPDDAAMLNTVFEDNLEFALTVIESARSPSRPVSSVGIDTKNAYHDAVTVSMANEQNIIINARKRGRAKLKYQIDGGAVQKARFVPARGSNFNTVSGTHYDRYEAMIKGQSVGSNVTYWIKAGKEKLGPYSYTVTGNPEASVLIIAAEDYSSGLDNAPPYANTTAPNYLHYYTAALEANGVSYNVWDIDAQKAAPALANLCGHDAVIWYTGNDFKPHALPDWAAHEATRLAARDYINYCDGKLLVTGQGTSYPATVYSNDIDEITGTYLNDDFWQYIMGGFVTLAAGGQDAVSHLPYDIKGEANDPIFGGLNFALNGGTGANNQVQAGTFLSTSSFLPQFPFDIAAKYDGPGNPFGPTSGDYYVYSQQADLSFKRLGGSYTLPASGDLTMSLQMSYDIENDWDYAFVEISEVGSDVWTTLPELNGRTSTRTGDSCTSGWVNQIHPHIGNYMSPPPACNSTGTTGEWHAFTGQSGGWQLMQFDLSAYAGKNVELYVSYASDWGTQNLGIFVDDVTIPGQGLNDLEAGLGSLTISSAPGSPSTTLNWNRIMPSDFPVGPALRSKDTVYLGFGFEAIDTAANRNTVMQRILQYFSAP